MFVAAIDENPVGFIYGYHSRPGQWWHDQVRDSLINGGHGSWVENSLELAEVAVLPAFQGRGIGTRLIDAFLLGVDQPVLLAVEANRSTWRRTFFGRSLSAWSFSARVSSAFWSSVLSASSAALTLSRASASSAGARR